MNKSKAAIVISQIIEKIEMIAGGGWGILCIFTVVVNMSDDIKDEVSTIVIFLVMALLGFWAFFRGRKRKKMRLEFKKYVAQLSIDPTGSLENIAAATGTSVETVKKNLQYMINKKFFTNAYIDEANNQLILPSISQKSQEQTKSEQVKSTTCKCPNCGGMNKIAVGTVTECDFCGSPLRG